MEENIPLYVFKLISVAKNANAKRTIEEVFISNDEKDLILKATGIKSSNQVFDANIILSYQNDILTSIRYSLFEKNEEIKKGTTSTFKDNDLLNIKSAIDHFRKGINLKIICD